jgi:hypothetical protein
MKVSSTISTNPRKFWAFVNVCHNYSRIPDVISHDNRIAVGSDRSELFIKFFSECFVARDLTSENLINDNSLPPAVNSTLSDLQTSPHEVFEFLCRITPHRSMGPDGISPIFLRNCASSLCIPLSIIFNRCFFLGIFPSQWKCANVIPIHKSGSKSDVTTYRSIS